MKISICLLPFGSVVGHLSLKNDDSVRMVRSRCEVRLDFLNAHRNELNTLIAPVYLEKHI